jgi:hypothetical protein
MVHMPHFKALRLAAFIVNTRYGSSAFGGPYVGFVTERKVVADAMIVAIVGVTGPTDDAKSNR